MRLFLMSLKINIVTSPTLTNVVIFYVYLPQLILSFDNVIVHVIAVNLVSIQNCQYYQGSIITRPPLQIQQCNLCRVM